MNGYRHVLKADSPNAEGAAAANKHKKTARPLRLTVWM
jgi:hypothetical protein